MHSQNTSVFHRVLSFLSIVSLIFSCSGGSDFSSNSPRAGASDLSTQINTASIVATSTATSKSATATSTQGKPFEKNSKNDRDGDSNRNSSDSSNPKEVDTRPDQVVEGQEVFGDCRRCLERAKQLGKTIGLIPDMNLTVNMGPFKIDPALNLCDIHFLPSSDSPIANHDGEDSILENQIAVYCPCNCGWSRDNSNKSFIDLLIP